MVINFRQLTDQLERIYSRRLALREVSLADGWVLYEATRNPLFNRHLLWDQPASEAETLARVDAVVDASRRGRMAAISAVVKTTGEWVSLFRFQPYRDDSLAMEMGVWTHDRFWHGRYSLELGRLCVDAAFMNSNVTRLVGAAAPENRSSCQLMQVVGMAPRDVVLRPTESGRPVELQEFSIERAEWLANRRSAASFQVFEGGAVDFVKTPTPAPRRAEREEELLAA